MNRNDQDRRKAAWWRLSISLLVIVASLSLPWMPHLHSFHFDTFDFFVTLAIIASTVQTVAVVMVAYHGIRYFRNATPRKRHRTYWSPGLAAYPSRGPKDDEPYSV